MLLVIDSLDGGGAERYVADLAIALRSRGWDVEVACSAAGVRAARLRAANVPVNVLAGSLVKRRLSLRYVRALRRVLAQGRYDVVHAHLYASAAAAAAAVPRDTPLGPDGVLGGAVAVVAGMPGEDASLARLQGVAEEAGLAVQWGRKALEVRPPGCRSKRGSRWPTWSGASRPDVALFGGNDVTAFDALDALVADGSAARCG